MAKEGLDGLTPGVWSDSSGSAITICVIHELNSDYPKHVQANAVVGGLSVCDMHLGRLAGALARGYTVAEILNGSFLGESDEIEKETTTAEVSNVKLRVTSKAVPTQIEGVAYGKNVYFRERHGSWTFGVGDSEEEAVDNSMIRPLVEAECPEFMDAGDAMELVKVLVEIYSRGGNSWFEEESDV